MNIQEFYEEHLADKILREEFFPDYDYKGIIVEVGAATPNFISFTKHFRENGWRAIHIEPNPIFVEMHKNINNEVYEYACSYEDKDNVDFTIVSINPNGEEGKVTDHSFSSLEVKDEYKNLAGGGHFDGLNKKTIKVNVRKLDTIFKEIEVTNVDVLTVDTEGWELEVMMGLTILKPSIVVLENLTYCQEYNDFMKEKGYTFLKNNFHNFIYKNDEKENSFFGELS